jgi:hypothetical protein
LSRLCDWEVTRLIAWKRLCSSSSFWTKQQWVQLVFRR